MDQRPENKQIMVPLTSSLYVPGELVGNNVLVEAGASYFIEKDCKAAMEYTDRKAKGLEEKAKMVGEFIS